MFQYERSWTVKYFLGLEVARSKEGIYLCQRKYASNIVAEVGLLGCRPTRSPIDKNHNLAKSDSVYMADPETYRRLVGRLIYWQLLDLILHTLFIFSHSL